MEELGTALTGALSDITSLVTDNIGAVLGVVVLFVGVGIVTKLIRRAK